MPPKLKNSPLERLTYKFTNWVGTPQSILIHSLLFVGIFSLRFAGLRFDEIMLILTTAVSLEAIYLSLFIQMTVNRHSVSLEDVGEDLEEIQEDFEGFESDIDKIQDHVVELNKDVDEISEDIDRFPMANLDQLKAIKHNHTGLQLETVERQLQVIMKELETMRQELKAPHNQEGTHEIS